MGQVSFTDFRARTAAHLDRIEADRTELIVTRRNREPVVVLPLADWERMQETLNILGSPSNARSLLNDMRELDGHAVETRDLTER